MLTLEEIEAKIEEIGATADMVKMLVHKALAESDDMDAIRYSVLSLCKASCLAYDKLTSIQQSMEM